MPRRKDTDSALTELFSQLHARIRVQVYSEVINDLGQRIDRLQHPRRKVREIDQDDIAVPVPGFSKGAVKAALSKKLPASARRDAPKEKKPLNAAQLRARRKNLKAAQKALRLKRLAESRK